MTSAKPQTTNIRSGEGGGTSLIATFGGVVIVDATGHVTSYTPEQWQLKLLNDRLKAIEEKMDLLLEAVHAR